MAGATAPRGQLDRLARLSTLADLRYSQMVHAVLQAVTLWDFHVLAALSGGRPRWFARGPMVRRSGRVGCVSAIASVAHDNPDWAFPQFRDSSDEAAMLVAQRLGHPLLPATARVVNDVSLGPPGTFLLVTGSNMSGKSTSCAIGINIVLAQAGGPVAARGFSLPPCEVTTSMRIEDSLADGTSLFMAELKRLKQVVDQARATRGTGIVGGSSICSMKFCTARIRSSAKSPCGASCALVRRGAIGAISTHDLALANVAPLDRASTAVHFQERIEPGPNGRRMTFDYRLRPGLATTTNALALLELVGLAAPEDDLHEPPPNDAG